MNFMNYKGESVEIYSAANHEDLPDDSLWDATYYEKERRRLTTIWETYKDQVQKTSSDAITGPTVKMAVLLALLHKYPERAITGTDYVASFGKHEDFPGFTPRTGGSCTPAPWRSLYARCARAATTRTPRTRTLP